MLQLEANIKAIAEHITGADMVAKLESGGKAAAVVVIQARHQVDADAGFTVQALFIVALEAEHWCEADISQILGLARNILILVLTEFRQAQIPVAAELGAAALPEWRIPVPLGGNPGQLALVASTEFERRGVNGEAG